MSDTEREQTERPESSRRTGDGEKSSPRPGKSGGGSPEKSGSTTGGGSTADGNWQGDSQRTHKQSS